MKTKHVVLTIVLTMLLGLTALAQTPAPDPQATPQGSTPSAQPQTSPSQSPDMTNSDQGKGEKKLKGCIQSEGGQFMLQDKHGKSTVLTGSQELSSHVGHTVTVHGTYAGGGASGVSSGTSAKDEFTVSKIDMVSDSCKEKADKSKDHDNSKPSPYQQ